MSDIDILESRVLVLNSNYIPINITTLKKAIKKIVKNVAEIVTVEADDKFQSFNFMSWADMSQLKKEFQELDKYDEIIGIGGFTFIVPRIIRILTYNKYFKHSVKLSRRNVFARDKNQCQYCGKKFPLTELTLDHVKPRSHGGISIWENLVCACFKCNTKKGGKTPEQAGMKLLKAPIQPTVAPTLKATIGHEKYASWDRFIAEVYWNIPLSK